MSNEIRKFKEMEVKVIRISEKYKLRVEWILDNGMIYVENYICPPLSLRNVMGSEGRRGQFKTIELKSINFGDNLE